MSVVVIAAPTALPIGTEAARRRLRVSTEDIGNVDLERLVKAATQQIDGPTGWVGRAFITQTLELRLDEFCDRIKLPYPPFIEIVSVKYDDDDGEEQTLNASNYRVVGGDRPFLILSANGSWPTLSGEEECVRIRYKCGYGEDEDDVPAKAQEAILVMAKAAYDLGDRNIYVGSEQVEGVGAISYVVNENAQKVMREAAENLLQGLVVYV
jgi:uncharacterized phiE125 gp8 family phage protein